MTEHVYSQGTVILNSQPTCNYPLFFTHQSVSEFNLQTESKQRCRHVLGGPDGGRFDANLRRYTRRLNYHFLKITTIRCSCLKKVKLPANLDRGVPFAACIYISTLNNLHFQENYKCILRKWCFRDSNEARNPSFRGGSADFTSGTSLKGLRFNATLGCCRSAMMQTRSTVATQT